MLTLESTPHSMSEDKTAPRATEARIDRGDAVNLAMDWLENRPTLTPKGIQALCNAVMLMDKTLSTRPAIIEEWHGGKVEHIPEYFAKPKIVEGLAEAHPILLVRQMANEILRLRDQLDQIARLK
jgi:hypothetical protein